MLKILSISMLTLIVMYNMQMINIILSSLMLIMLMKPNIINVINKMMLTDSLSMIMMLLSLISITLIILSTNSMKTSNTIIPIMIILMITFSSNNLLMFYIFFELVLIPTMILISSKGNQPERLQASIYLLIYTITASLPLLINILQMYNSSFMSSILMMKMFNLPMLVFMAFLAKLPMFFLHLWLPKAHVEAPLEGSMVLASILLKLGGYGLIRFTPMSLWKMNSINPWMISISLIGMTATSLNCIRQKDLKSLIAYSSVAHMSLVLSSIFSKNSIGLMGATIMMIAHGLSSSAMFLLVNDLYMKFHSRNIILFKGMMMMMPNMTFWWFMFIATNISAPPSINTISEILIMSSLLSWSHLTMFMLMMASIMTASFSISLFINISHNHSSMTPTPQSSSKTFLSLFIHLIPLIIMLMKMNIML